MGPARRKLEAEFGPFAARKNFYYEDGRKGVSSSDEAAVSRMRTRLGVVNDLVLSLDETLEHPSTRQLETAGYRMDDASAGPEDDAPLSHAKCFKLELLEEMEDITAWVAGYIDASCAPATQTEAVEHDGCVEVPTAPWPTTAEVAAVRGKRLVGVTRLADARGISTDPCCGVGSACIR